MEMALRRQLTLTGFSLALGAAAFFAVPPPVNASSCSEGECTYYENGEPIPGICQIGNGDECGCAWQLGGEIQEQSACYE